MEHFLPFFAGASLTALLAIFIVAAAVWQSYMSQREYRRGEAELKEFMHWAHQENLAADRRLERFLADSHRETQRSLDRIATLTGMVFERVDQRDQEPG